VERVFAPSKWLKTGLLTLWMLFALLPLYWTVVTAFKLPKAIYSGPFFIPGVDFEISSLSWQTLLGEERANFIKGLLNSMIFASASSFFAVLLGAFAAYGLARYRYHYGLFKNDDLSFLIVSQRIMPPIVSVLAFFVIFRTFKLLDTHVGMILVYTAFNLPLALYLLKDFFSGIPRELEEAAAVDGYGKLDQIVRVVLPLTAPGLAAAYMLSFFFTWNEFLFALMLTFDNANTLPVIITSWNTRMEPKWWFLSAVSIIAIIPPSIVAVLLDRSFLERRFLRGMR
jgi:multiple sugar transport system permease protein